MTPLTVNPTVVILVNKPANGVKVVKAIATNVAPDLQVVLVDNEADYKAEACNKPFDTTRPVVPETTFSSHGIKRDVKVG